MLFPLNPVGKEPFLQSIMSPVLAASTVTGFAPPAAKMPVAVPCIVCGVAIPVLVL